MVNRLPQSSDCEDTSDKEPVLDTLINCIIQNLSVTEAPFLVDMTVKNPRIDDKEGGSAKCLKKDQDKKEKAAKELRSKHQSPKISDQHSQEHCDYLVRRDVTSNCAFADHATKQILKRKSTDQDFVSKPNRKMFGTALHTNLGNGGHISEEEEPENVTMQEIERQTQELERILMERYAWKIVRVKSDGACLFRSVAYHIFGDQESHLIVRQCVMDYMMKNRDHFVNFVSQDFDQYIARKRLPFTYGNHVEIQAIAELYNRPIEIYQDGGAPLKVNSNHGGNVPMRLSYHSGIHYNAVVDPRNPSIGKGLGMREELQPLLPEADLYDEALLRSSREYDEAQLISTALEEEEQSVINDQLIQRALYESYKTPLGVCSENENSKISFDDVVCSSSAAAAGMDEETQMDHALAESRMEYFVKMSQRNDGASSSSSNPKPPPSSSR